MGQSDTGDCSRPGRPADSSGGCAATAARPEGDLQQSGENQYATFTYDDNNGLASFKAYRIKPNAGCTDFTDFKVGAVVLIRCKIYKYASSVIENDETGEILSISFTAAPLQQIDVNKDNLEYLRLKNILW